MRRIALTAALLIAFGALGAAAQNAPPGPVWTATRADIWCAGQVTTEEIPYDTYVISGEEADPKTVFSRGDYLYVNKGSSQGAQIGDEYMIMRPVKEETPVPWFHGERQLAREMGRQWKDVGRARVVVVHPDVSIVRVGYACDYIQRGDTVRPAVEYPAPAFKPVKDFDRFAPPSGKAQGRIVRGKDYYVSHGRGSVVYINLASKDGVKPGDYVRIFRDTAANYGTVYQLGNLQERVYGFGKTPRRYERKDVPREVLGEGVILRTTASSSTVLLFNSVREIYQGDSVEVE
jgi:hypothetical protein